MSRYLILLAALAGGCEQLKSPQKIRELEDRVDKLSKDVVALQGSGSGSAKPAGHAGSGAGSGEGSAAEPGGAGSGSGSGSEERVAAGSAGEGGSGSGSGEHASAPGSAGEGGAGSGSGSGERVAAAGSASGGGSGSAKEGGAAAVGSGSAEGHEGAHAGAEPPGDAGVGDGGAGDQADHALEELRSVVAKATAAAAARPGGPAGSAPPPGPPGLPQWSYDGKTGPAAWGALEPAWHACGAGKAQSPIDIEPRAGAASPIVFHYRPTPATVYDEGHLLQVNLAPGSTIEIDGRVYQLLQFHFHMPSEHAIAGEHYPLEVHLLHQDADGRLAMIAVLYDAGAESRALGGLWARWPRKPGTEDKVRKPFDPTELLPETRTVFRYTGSLTTPPCTEGVVWNVMRRAMSDSKAHLEDYAKHYPHTAREPQPLGDRKIE